MLRLIFLIGLLGAGLPFCTPNQPLHDADLDVNLAQIAARADGNIGIAVIHVESGTTTVVHGDAGFPLYSVFKLPLAIAILQAVDTGRLHLDQSVQIAPEDIAPGHPSNTRRWAEAPLDTTIRDLLEVALVHSDNTSSDKLLELADGPKAFTQHLKDLGFTDLIMQAPYQHMAQYPHHPNRGSARSLARLLAAFQRGELLQAETRQILWNFMAQAQTGQRRLRGALPETTMVLDKTGTGPNHSATHDVGLIVLPDNRGHLAIAVLMADSALPTSAQEDLIAEVGRVAHDAYLPQR